MSGTGKTTVARKMAELFYEMGILLTKDYLECSASDLIAQFVGQSAPRTRDTLKKGLGKVLFIDEAYRLCDGEFGREAVNELVDCLTKPLFVGKIVIILAGYTEDINRLLKVNPGLCSRFPEEVVFGNMQPEECLTLLYRQLQQNGIDIGSELQDTGSESYLELIATLKELSSLSSWGNGRDIKTISKSLTAAAYEGAGQSSPSLTVTIVDVFQALKSMLKSQRARCTDETQLGGVASKSLNQRPEASPPMPFNITNSISCATDSADPNPVMEKEKIENGSQLTNSSPRDLGVSDEIWQQLQANIAANEASTKSLHESIAAQERNIENFKEKEIRGEQTLSKLREIMMETSHVLKDEIDDLKRKHEEEKLRNLTMKRAKEAAEENLRKAREEEARRRQEEARVQKKLREMSVCPAGFRWVKERSGYRCAGGAHFVPNGQLDL